MAHLGKTFPAVDILRDLVLNEQIWYPPKRWKIYLSTALSGPLAFGWWGPHQSNDATYDVDASEIRWMWDPPPTADPKLFWETRMTVGMVSGVPYPLFDARPIYDGTPGTWGTKKRAGYAVIDRWRVDSIGGMYGTFPSSWVGPMQTAIWSAEWADFE